MQLKDITKTLDEMTDEELKERLRAIRHNREVARPVAAKRTAKAEKKASSRKVSTAEKLLAGLSDEDKAALIAQLEGLE